MRVTAWRPHIVEYSLVMIKKKLDVFLVGSCVSRDLQGLWAHRFYRRAYIARQSIISATTPAYVFEGEHRLDSAWQHRMVQGDLASNLLTRLAEDAARTDLVIWDLTDERLGVQPLGDGSFGTLTPDSLRSGILEAFEEVGDPVRFGTPEHLELWEHALERFVTLLEALGLRSRTFVLRPQWASQDADGEDLEPEGGLSAAQWAETYAPYVALVEAAGLPVLSLPESLVRTHQGHRWGIAPYHYVDEAYTTWAHEIEARVEALGGKRPLHAVPPEPVENPKPGRSWPALY